METPTHKYTEFAVVGVAGSTKRTTQTSSPKPPSNIKKHHQEQQHQHPNKATPNEDKKCSTFLFRNMIVGRQNLNN